MTSALLDAARVEALLTELAQRLTGQNVTGIRVVGGAAISFLNPHRRLTHDIDAVVSPPGIATHIVTEMANAHGLPADWLNDAAKAYVPFTGPDDWRPVLSVDGVTVSIACSELLLAMKLRANRGRRDSEDIEFLLDACGVTSVAEADSIYERYHHQETMSDAARIRVSQWLGA